MAASSRLPATPPEVITSLSSTTRASTCTSPKLVWAVEP